MIETETCVFKHQKRRNWLNEHKLLRIVWLVLMALTLLSALTAEAADPALWSVLFISLIISVKGQLVVDRLMGLRYAKPVIRYSMLSYFYLLPLLIVWALVFPEQLARLTSL